MYRYLDKLLEIERRKVKIEFNHLGMMGFDELNVLNTKKVTQALFDKFLADNERLFLLSAKDAYRKAIKFARAEGFDGSESEVDGDLIALVLGGYNFTTGYLYRKEAERKRLRLNEQILTAREYDNRTMFRDSIRRAADLWWTQTVQYGISMVDTATLKGFRDMGVTEVRWIAADDEKTCPTCGARDNKVYPVDKVPPKPHYQCRCYIVPVNVGEDV